jgi:hypothetical protein
MAGIVQEGIGTGSNPRECPTHDWMSLGTSWVSSPVMQRGDDLSDRAGTAMDCAMHSSLARSVRASFVCDCLHDRTAQASPAGRWTRGVFCVGKAFGAQGGEVTPTPPCRLPATYTAGDPVYVDHSFWDPHQLRVRRVPIRQNGAQDDC